MKSLIAAVTLVLLVLLGVHIDSGFPTDYLSAFNDYYVSSQAAFEQISSDLWFTTKTDGWLPSLQCPSAPDPFSISVATDPPPLFMELFCSKPTDKSSNELNGAKNSHAKDDDDASGQSWFSVNPAHNAAPIMHWFPSHPIIDDLVAVLTSDGTPPPDDTTTSNDALGFEALLDWLNSEEGEHELNDNNHTITESVTEVGYEIPTKETQLFLVDWYDVLQYAHAIDRESPTSKWLEYLEFLLLLSFTVHIALHFRDYAEFNGLAFWEHSFSLNRHANEPKSALLEQDFNGHEHDKKMTSFIQRNVKTIKIASVSKDGTFQPKMDAILPTKAPQMLTETAFQHTADKITESIKDNSISNETATTSIDKRRQTDTHATNRTEPTQGRAHVSVSRAATCLMPVF